ncbi:tRNA isopentenyltransferase, partial [Rhizoclosmatium globosum]
MDNLPVVAVVGTTGVGKSNLAIEIALALDGEVVNADSMQVYKGLDVITNKVTLEERNLAVHHLLDFIDPIEEDDYSVLKFERDALRVIADIHSRGKVPILVGGTHYYIQSVLWDSNLVSSSDQAKELDEQQSETDEAHSSLPPELALEIGQCLANSSISFKPSQTSEHDPIVEQLGRLLARVDPIMATRWHPKDWRKIRRSLQVYYTKGERHSDILNRQKEEGGGALRFRTCVFWLWAENKALDLRLDNRVDAMIKNGLFDEINDMRQRVREANGGKVEIDYTRGIMQTIGFKEFDAYLNMLEGRHDPKEVESLRKQSVESMQAATRRYARRQVTWIKNKLGPKCLEEAKKAGMQSHVTFYALDATDLSNWKSSVRDEGVQLCRNFIAGTQETEPTTLTVKLLGLESTVSTSNQTRQTDWVARTCDICVDAKTGEPKLVHGAREWEIHIKSNAHAKSVKRAKWKAEFKQWEENNKRQKTDTD